MTSTRSTWTRPNGASRIKTASWHTCLCESKRQRLCGRWSFVSTPSLDGKSCQLSTSLWIVSNACLDRPQHSDRSCQTIIVLRGARPNRPHAPPKKSTVSGIDARPINSFITSLSQIAGRWGSIHYGMEINADKDTLSSTTFLSLSEVYSHLHGSRPMRGEVLRPKSGHDGAPSSYWYKRLHYRTLNPRCLVRRRPIGRSRKLR